MKAIKELNNEEKARLIVDLFPETKPVILEMIEAVAGNVIENGEHLRSNWNNPIISFTEWQYLAKEINKVTAKNKKDMLRNNRQFCYLLFLGYRGIFTIDSFLRVAYKGEQPKAFNAIVHALFNVPQAYDLIVRGSYDNEQDGESNT